MPRRLFALLLVAATSLSANEISYHSLQSGPHSSTTPLYDHGIHGEGQVIAVLDTGLDYDSCYFAEPDNATPPINTGTPSGGLAWTNVDPSRRKVIAYDFLYSCAQFPDATYCEDPTDIHAYDNQGHGTHAAASALGDRATPLVHDYGDAIALGAKLVVQDAGLSDLDNCTSRPGIGCPVDITPALDQAYKQGARIHSNSWGDRQGTSAFGIPPTANYSAAARDIDAFVFTHPDMLVVFNTGNFGSNGLPPASSLSAPGCAKNTLQVGGTRVEGREDDVLSSFTLYGPTRDGRIKPDVVGPAYVLAGDTDGVIGSKNCDTTFQGGTSWASPTLAGAAALVRQYYTEGFYPTGVKTAANAMIPSAALLKATIIAAARPVKSIALPSGDIAAQPTPSGQQGWGFPVLHDVLTFPGDQATLRVGDVPLASGLIDGETRTTTLNVRAGVPLKLVLVWTDPAGVARSEHDATPELVNDLDLRVTLPSGASIFGNDSLHAGQADRLNNVEVVTLPTPESGSYVVSVNAHHLGSGLRQSYALVMSGDFSVPTAPARSRLVRH